MTSPPCSVILAQTIETLPCLRAHTPVSVHTMCRMRSVDIIHTFEDLNSGLSSTHVREHSPGTQLEG